MDYRLSSNILEKLEKSGISFLRSTVEDIDDILDVYLERMKWFKENNIKQWGKYLEHHLKANF